MKNEKKSSEDRWIDIHNDTVMVSMGLMRPAMQSPRDPDVWSKTFNEKKELRKAKAVCKKKDMHFKGIPLKEIPVRSKLIITLCKNNTFNKSTYSVECYQHQISRILSRFTESAKNIVKSYYWNGRTYSERQLPFWR